MRARSFLCALLGLLSSIAFHAAEAQNPFVGSWKMNQDQSQLTGDTLKFIPAEGQAIELTSGGQTYSFRTDGNNYRLPSGDIAIWRQTGPAGWTTEYRKIDGKLLYIDTWKLSADGKNLSLTTTGAKANGDLYTNTEEYERTTGTDGLLGTWKSTQLKLSSPNELTVVASGLDRLSLKIPSQKLSCTLTYDGKEASLDGPDVPEGLRLSLTRTGPYGFRLVQKMNGTVISTSQYTVSDDGKTMTKVGGAPGDPPSTTIWEKQ